MPAEQANALETLKSRFGEEQLRQWTTDSVKKPVDKGFGPSLPPGIKNGVAQLDSCRFEVVPANAPKYAGHVQLRLSATCVEPDYVYDQNNRPLKCAGLQSRPWPIVIADTTTDDGTKTSAAKNLDLAINEIRLLAGEHAIPEGAGIDFVAKVMENLEAKKPYFRLNTRMGKVQMVKDKVSGKMEPKRDKAGKPYEARIWEDWQGIEPIPPNYQPPDYGAVDQTSYPAAAAAPSTNGQQVAPAPAVQPSAAPVAPVAATPPATAPATVPTTEPPIVDEATLMGWVELAEAPNYMEEPQRDLERTAKALGYPESMLCSTKDGGVCDNWHQVANLIRRGKYIPPTQPAPVVEAPTTTAAAPAVVSVAIVPEKGKNYLWGDRKIQVMMVDQEAKTVVVRDLETNKMISNPTDKKATAIPWDKLAPAAV